MKSPDWIVINQQTEILKKYPGPVVWVNQCQRCDGEEPVYQGPLDIALFASKRFLQFHKDCKAPSKR